MEAKKIVGYLTPLCVKPGDKIAVKVSSDLNTDYHASMIELICGDSRSHGTGYEERTIGAGFEDDYPGRKQSLVPGSYAYLGALAGADKFGVGLWFYPTLLASEQVLVSGPNLIVSLVDGLCVVTYNNITLTLPLKLQERRWHQLQFTHDNAFLRATIRRSGKGAGEPNTVNESLKSKASAKPLEAGQWWLATGDHKLGGQFNGRIEAPVVTRNTDFETLVSDQDKMIAAWDFSQNMDKDEFTDVQGAVHGIFHQQPTRAVTGVRWDGTVQRWTDDPGHYGAVHFHDDDLVDANWNTDFEFEVPSDISSGLYAVKIVQQDEEDIMPFFVSPSGSQEKNKVALLMSTATYLAYANQRLSISGDMFGKGVRNSADQYLLDNPEVGNSLYEHHKDGSGVHFSSRLRPILNLKPKTIMWSFNADTNLTAWLKAIDQPFDVITDEQLHYEGSELLADYRVVITGTHPEYHSTNMLDSISSWLDNGGRLMYMGGNGFYWRIAYHPSNPAIIEVRRAEDGTRAWMAQAGEYYHQFTAEYGGLWRRLGRPPNELVGVGFSAQGFDGGTYYEFNAQATDPRVAFIMDGVEDKEQVGGYGTQGRGAAGEEIDRYDPSLGSPDHAVVLATSKEHRPGMLVTKEEFLMTVPIPKGSNVRADMTFFETPSGGAVFSTGSISYAGSLSVNSYANDIATMTGNVLKRFIDPTPFKYPPE